MENNSEVTAEGKAGDVEMPYKDEKGVDIKEFALIKVYHFKGVNDQGRGRKHYYIYKWIRLKEFKDGKKYWVAMHLNSADEKEWYSLRSVADKETRIIQGSQIIQQY